MNIELTSHRHKSIKNALGKRLPNVKSSHRAEALARGLGFKTNAALIAALNDSGPCVTPDGVAFSRYMRDHGFDMWPENAFADAVAEGAVTEALQRLTAVLNKEPSLSLFGFGIPQASKKSAKERNEDLRRLREETLDADSVRQFTLCETYLRSASKRKTINSKISSYGIKHRIEDHYRALNTPEYISNGILIIAAISAGFTFEIDGPNAYFNITLPPTPSEMVDKIHKHISNWARKPTWYTSHPLDQNRFRDAILDLS